MHHQDYMRPWRAGRQDDRSGIFVWGLGLGLLAGAGAYALLRQRSFREGLPRFGDDAPGRVARQRRFGRFVVTGRTVTIHRPRAEVYAFWRDFANLPQFMENVHAVETRGDTARWIIRAPAGREIALETRIVSDREGDQIAWQSTEGSQIETSGKVMFRDAPADRGTEVEAVIAWVPPAGELGRMVAKLFQADPEIQGRRELRRLKMLLETGEVATARNRKDAA